MVSTSADEYLVGVRHVDEGSALGAIFIADVESNVVFDVKFPFAFVVLEREA